LDDSVVSDTPLAYWKLDEVNGTTAADQMGSYPGTIVGSPSLGQPGLPSGGYSMGFGSGKYVDFGNVLNLSPDTTISVEAWIILPSGWGGTGSGVQFSPILTKGDTSYRVARGNTGDNIQWATQSGGTGSLTSTSGNPTLADGNWHHVVTVMDGTNKIIYIDGVSVGTFGNLSFASNSNSLRIGGNSAQTGRYFNGRIANVAVYDHDLTATQVLTHYKAGTATTQAQAGFNTNREEYLEFQVNTPSIDFGTLTTSTTKTGTATFQVKSYLANGYQVVTASAPPKNGSYTLAGMATLGASAVGTEQFGINLKANTSPTTFGANPVQVPDGTFSYGTATTEYSIANQYKYVNGDVIASSPRSSGETDYTISYIMNISNATPGGVYTMSHVLVATSTF
jgi:hypothetical protein